MQSKKCWKRMQSEIVQSVYFIENDIIWHLEKLKWNEKKRSNNTQFILIVYLRTFFLFGYFCFDRKFRNKKQKTLATKEKAKQTKIIFFMRYLLHSMFIYLVFLTLMWL